MSLPWDHFLNKSLVLTVFHLQVSSGERSLRQEPDIHNSGDSMSDVWEGICRPLLRLPFVLPPSSMSHILSLRESQGQGGGGEAGREIFVL